MILVDSNIPMYLVGATHPHKSDAQRLLEKLLSDRQRLVTDAEVLQETCTGMSPLIAEMPFKRHLTPYLAS